MSKCWKPQPLVRRGLLMNLLLLMEGDCKEIQEKNTLDEYRINFS